jgi:hypothetical protein
MAKKRVSDTQENKKKLLSLIDDENDGLNEEAVDDHQDPAVDIDDKKPIKEEPILGKTTPVIAGYRLLPLDSLPSRGKFYPDGTTIEFRAATVAEIKNYSAMDKDDPISVRKGISSITTKCIQIKVNDKIISSQRLKAADELFMLFAIRDYTMTKNGREHGISVASTCPECGTNNSGLVTHEKFSFYNVPDKVMKWYDELSKAFVIQHDRVCPDPVTVHVPSIGVISAITDYVKTKETKKARGEENAFYNKEYLQLIQYIIKDHNNLTESALDRKLRDFAKKPYYQISVLQNIHDLLEEAITPNYITKCKRDGCGHVYDAPFRFRRHIKYIFDISGVSDELF